MAKTSDIIENMKNAILIRVSKNTDGKLTSKTYSFDMITQTIKEDINNDKSSEKSKN